MMPCFFILKTCMKILVFRPLQNMTRKTPPIICVWCKSCVQPRTIVSMIGRCASWGKKEIMSSINDLFMIFLLFDLGLSLACLCTQKLQWEEQLQLLGQGFLYLKSIHSILIRTLGFQVKEWRLNFRGTRQTQPLTDGDAEKEAEAKQQQEMLESGNSFKILHAHLGP